MANYDIYLDELMTCIHEMVSENATAREGIRVDSLPGSCYISQLIIGDYTASTAVYADMDAMLSFATAYAQFEVSENERDEIIADFLNMINGRFAVKLSNSQSVECSLSVPVFTPPESVSLHADTYVIPVTFDFGEIDFVFSEN